MGGADIVKACSDQDEEMIVKFCVLQTVCVCVCCRQCVYVCAADSVCMCVLQTVCVCVHKQFNMDM